MKNKLITIVFIALFILIIWTVSSSAFTVDYESKTYDFGEDVQLLNYTLVYCDLTNNPSSFQYPTLYLCTFENEPYIDKYTNNNTTYNNGLYCYGRYW